MEVVELNFWIFGLQWHPQLKVMQSQGFSGGGGGAVLYMVNQTRVKIFFPDKILFSLNLSALMIVRLLSSKKQFI